MNKGIHKMQCWCLSEKYNVWYYITGLSSAKYFNRMKRRRERNTVTTRSMQKQLKVRKMLHRR